MKNEFIWGVATAATQIEGAPNQDGKTETIWDVMSKDGAFISDSHQVDTADDSYNKFNEDLELMKELGVGAYRFSLNWARIIKDGDGEINQKGLDYYSKLVDDLLAANIEPYITLFHWDLPYELYKKGGWLNRDITKAFKRYVEVVVDAIGHKVNHFITFNEPQCILGARLGGTIPEAKYSARDRNTMVHNLLLCHGEAVKVLRKCKNIKIGYAPCNDARIPLTSSKEDIEAARQSYFDVRRGDLSGVSVFSDPIIFGNYPKKYYEVNRIEDLPDIKDGDLELISQPIDFYCQNIYQGLYVKSDGNGGYKIVKPNKNAVYTLMNWVVSPESLYWGPKFLYERYKLPFYITENGCSVTDIITEDKKVHDSPRCEYIKQYIYQFKKAIDDGVDGRGYFCWSLLDNLEWFEGYKKRFGLVYVDFETYERIPKDSFYFYKNLIKK